MKKKISVVMIFLFLFATAVSASGLNGEYKGNPIVKVVSNGKTLDADEVPGQIIDGHTLVPISMLRQLGATVQWNQTDYSVNVTLPTATTKNVTDNKDLIDYVTRLVSLGENFNEYADLIGAASVASTNIKDTTAEDIMFFTNRHLNWLIDSYNALHNDYSSKNIVVSSLAYEANELMKNYYKNIDSWKLAINALYDYHKSSKQSDYTVYLTNDKIATDDSINNLKIANALRDGLLQNKPSKSETPITTPAPTPSPKPSNLLPIMDNTIESQIDGEFNGWEGETIFKLMNGQIWQQSSYAYMYSYSYMPDVTIYPSNGGYKMKVDGVDDTIDVKRIK